MLLELFDYVESLIVALNIIVNVVSSFVKANFVKS